MKRKKIVNIIGCCLLVGVVAFYFYGLNSESRMYKKANINSDKIEIIFDRKLSLTSEIRLIKNIDKDKIQVLEVIMNNYLIGQTYAKCNVIDLPKSTNNDDFYLYEYEDKYISFYVGEPSIDIYKKSYIEVDGFKSYMLEYNEGSAEVSSKKDKGGDYYTMLISSNKDILNKIMN